MEAIMSVFTKRFREELQKSGLTIKELSQKSGISTYLLKGYLAGKPSRARQLIALCRTFKVTADYLLGLD